MTDAADPIAGALNRLPKHVASKTLETAEWNNTTLVRDVGHEIASLKARYSRELQVHGSYGLCQTLLANGLVDELNLLVFPVVLGIGKRLFASGAVPTAMKLASTRTTGAGVVIATYQHAGEPSYGSFALDA